MMTIVVFDACTLRPKAFTSQGNDLKIPLSRGALKLLEFPSKRTTTSALLLFGSGDGGWGGFEEAIARAFQDQGWEVIGIDSHAYATTDYDLSTLQSDYGKIVQTALASLGKHPPPVIIGGYSMGAAQAIAAAGGPNPPPGLIGLLVIDPLSRGRYGLHLSDQMNILPDGPGTFSVDSFSNKMGSLRVVQWHAENDSIDSRRWLDSLTAQHKVFTFPGAGHTYAINLAAFLSPLVKSAQWILHPTPDTPETARPSETK